MDRVDGIPHKMSDLPVPYDLEQFLVHIFTRIGLLKPTTGTELSLSTQLLLHALQSTSGHSLRTSMSCGPADLMSPNCTP